MLDQDIKKQIKTLAKYAILKRKGYVIEKKHITKDEMEYIKRQLILTPVVHRDYIKNAPKIPIFFENDRRIYLPQYWACENIGTPNRNSIKDGKCFETELKTTFPPRDYQEPIVKKVYEQLQEKQGGIITIGCGGGKTFLAIYLSAILKQKTLIIVHTSVLLNQWIDRINTFIPEAKIGIIQGKKFDIEGKDYVIAMLQSIVSVKKGYTSNTFKDFGTTIVDEVHHIAAPSFSKALPIICTKYTIGLSATPERNDKLEKIFYWHLGPSAWYDRKREGIYTLVKNIKYFDENYEEKRNWNGGYDLHKMLEQIVNNKKRNKFIIKQTKYYSLLGRQTLVLSNRRNHLEVMKAMFDKKPLIKNHYKKIVKELCNYKNINDKIKKNITEYVGQVVTSGFYVGGMKKEALEISSKCDVLFATYQLVAEGTDIPTLNTLIMGSPRKEVEQIVGRIQRAETKHKPLVLDICDMFSVYKNQGRYREKFYKKQDYFIDNIDFNANTNEKLPIIKDKEPKKKCNDIKSFLKKTIKKKMKPKSKIKELLTECLLTSD